MKRIFSTFTKLSLITMTLVLGSNTMALAGDHGHGHGHGHGRWDDRYDRWDDRHGRGHGWGHHRERDVYVKNIYVQEPRWDRYDRYVVKRRHIPYRMVESYPVFDSYQHVQVNCIPNQQILGTVVGGLAGGLIGNQFGKGNGRVYTTVGGAILGSAIGNSLTIADRGCATQVLEYATPGTQVSWRNPDNGYAYTVLPTNNYMNSDGRYCREYHSVAYVGSQQQETYGTACRQPDGAWEIVNTR